MEEGIKIMLYRYWCLAWKRDFFPDTWTGLVGRSRGGSGFAFSGGEFLVDFFVAGKPFTQRQNVTK